MFRLIRRWYFARRTRKALAWVDRHVIGTPPRKQVVR